MSFINFIYNDWECKGLYFVSLKAETVSEENVALSHIAQRRYMPVIKCYVMWPYDIYD